MPPIAPPSTPPVPPADRLSGLLVGGRPAGNHRRWTLVVSPVTSRRETAIIAVLAAALAAGGGVVAVSSATSADGGTTLTVVDPVSGDQREVELDLDEPSLSQRGHFVVAIGEDDDDMAVLVDTRDGTISDLARTRDLNRNIPIDWFQSTGEPLLMVNSVEQFVLRPESGERFEPPTAELGLLPGQVTADATTFSLRGLSGDLIVDLAAGTDTLIDGGVVELSSTIAVVSHDDDLELIERSTQTAEPAPASLHDWSTVPVGPDLVYLTGSGDVMAVRPGSGTDPLVLGSVASVDQPRLVSLADPVAAVISAGTETYLVDPATSSTIVVGETGDRLPFVATSAAGVTDLDWACVPLLGSGHVTFVDATSGGASTMASDVLAGADPSAVELAALLTSDGCTFGTSVDGSWMVATPDAVVTGTGRLRWLADDGSAAIVGAADDWKLVTIADPDSPVTVDEHTVLVEAATGSPIGW